MKLKDINTEDRPRERLMVFGASALSNSELMAILLRTGGGGKNVIELAMELLKKAGSLTGLSSMPPDKMKEISGIGNDKAAMVCAAFELGRRFSAEDTNSARITITSSVQVWNIFRPILKGLDHEECWILYLNRANIVIGKEKITSGGISSTIFDTGTIIRKALEKKAQGIIVVHNHPSGNPRPGNADLNSTKTLKTASESVGISLLDHVIIADGCYYSFADERVQTTSEVADT